MKKIFGLGIISMLFILTACNNQQQEHAGSTTDSTAAMSKDVSTENKFTAEMVDNKKDPTCGMPVTAGIGDTVHYDKHVLGFCSKECKDEFLKNPKASIAAAEIK